MNLSPHTLWSIVLPLSAAALAASGWSRLHAARSEHSDLLRLARLTHAAHSLSSLKSNLPDWALAPKAAGTLAPEVSATLASCALPPSTIISLSADPESAGTSGPSATGFQLRTRHATLALGSITLPQLGAFLQSWRQRQPRWTCSALDVSPEPNAAALKAQTGGDLPLHAVLTMESLSLEQPRGVR